MTTRKTVFITGASRGIGLAIAKALSATNNFNLAIASKTTTVQKTLPGTIYTAADEIRALGGDCLALECDIRFEDQIQTAVSKTVDRFGGIDVVINNASAIDLSTMEQGSLKKFDLMNQINSRGTWLVSKICLPFLEISARNNRNPMILMMAPPLDLRYY